MQQVYNQKNVTTVRKNRSKQKQRKQAKSQQNKRSQQRSRRAQQQNKRAQQQNKRAQQQNRRVQQQRRKSKQYNRKSKQYNRKSKRACGGNKKRRSQRQRGGYNLGFSFLPTNPDGTVNWDSPDAASEIVNAGDTRGFFDAEGALSRDDPSKQLRNNAMNEDEFNARLEKLEDEMSNKSVFGNNFATKNEASRQWENNGNNFATKNEANQWGYNSPN